MRSEGIRERMLARFPLTVDSAHSGLEVTRFVSHHKDRMPSQR